MDNSTSKRRRGATGVASAGLAPALAHVNPQPRLPGTKAPAARQPVEFIERARSLRLGSYRLKVAYLALCRLARTWVREDSMLEIAVKQDILAGELECKRDTLVALLRDLKLTPYVRVHRGQHSSLIRLFVDPQPSEALVPESVETGPTQLSVDAVLAGRDPSSPAVAVAGSGGESASPVAPRNGATGDPKSSETPPSVAPRNGATGDPGASSASVAPRNGATADPKSGPRGRIAGTCTSGSGKQQQQYPPNPPTTKQLSGIASMAAELGCPVPAVVDRLEADGVFRELRAAVEERRRAAAPPGRPHRVHRLNAYGTSCVVCKLHRPDFSKPCPGPPLSD